MLSRYFYDRYEIIKELAVTNHSIIYLVRHRMLGVYRVAKVFKRAGKQDDRLLREAHRIKDLRHPQIPIIYDIEQGFGDDKDSVCIIEEYIAGKSLREYVDEQVMKYGHMKLQDVCRIGIELCHALEYLHTCGEQGILHMDIKPDNIMIDEKNQVKLIDFDNAVCMGAGMTTDNGTPLFAAPEQYDGEEAAQQSDIYSLGVVVLYMVSNGHICADGNHNISGVDARYSPLYHLIKKSLRHSRGMRYGSVADLRKELESIINLGGTDKHISYIVLVAGVKSGIGTTHTVMSMAHFFHRAGYSCLTVDRSGNDDMLTEALTGTLMQDGTYLCGGVRILPDYRGAITVEDTDADVVIVDCGCAADGCEVTGYTDIVRVSDRDYSVVKVLVSGRVVTRQQTAIAAEVEPDAIMINLVNAEQFYDAANMTFAGKKCYRIPCIYDCRDDNPIFDETMNDFLQDNLSVLRRRRLRISVKECISRVYEFFRDISEVKAFRKKKGQQEYNCN